MIHIFNGCKEICNLPAKACSACSECMNSCEPACKQACAPCSKCAESCGNCWHDFFNRPLGGYVLMAVWLSALELGFCGYALYKEAVPGAVNLDAELDSFLVDNVTAAQVPKAAHHGHHGHPAALFKDCRLTDNDIMGVEVGIKQWIYVQMGLAVLNLLFAPYFQCRLWSQLNDGASPDDRGAVAVSQEKVKQSFEHVFLHDFGVCFYTFAIIFSYWWSEKGIVWAHSDDVHCNPQGWISRSASFGLFFFWFTSLYACGWWCYMYCMASTETLTLRRGAAVYQSPDAASANRQQAGAPLTAPAQGAMTGSPVADPLGPTTTPTDPGIFARLCRGKQIMKLAACIGLDFMGNASYFIPAFGEVGDAGWAPAQAVMLQMMFNANGIAMLGLVEELLPYTDVLPTATIAWCLETFAPNSPFARMLGIDGSIA